MASEPATTPSGPRETGACAALQHTLWRSLRGLSSGLQSLGARIEQFLAQAGLERAPWIAVGFAAGIGLWFQLATPMHWLGLLCICAALGLGALGLLRREGQFPYLRLAIATLAIALAAGCLTVWVKSTLVGAAAISQPASGTILGRVLARQKQPAEGWMRLVLATREPGTARAIRVRLNVPS